MEKALTRFIYRFYARFSRYDTWKKNKFPLAGNLLIYALILTACLGIDTFRSIVYQLFSLLFSLFAVSALLALKPLKGLVAKRFLPEYGTAGTPVSYTILVENRTDRLKKGFAIQERFRSSTPSLQAFTNIKEPHEHRRNPWDRKLKVHRWKWLARRKENAVVMRMTIPDVPPKGHVDIRAELTPLNRGAVYLNGFTFLKKEPLGFMRAFYHTRSEARLLVLPERYNIPALGLPGSQKHHASGVALTSKVGNSEEFVSLREYRPGDPMRLIHWKSLAKTGKLIIRENRDERFVRHALILDTHIPEGFDQCFEAAVSIVASYVSKLETGESLLDLFFAGNRVYHYASGRGLADSTKFLEILALIQPAKTRDFSPVSRAVLKYQQLLSGCILVFNSLDSERINLIDTLGANGIATTCFLVADKGGRKPERPVYLIDPNNIQAGLNKVRSGP